MAAEVTPVFWAALGAVLLFAWLTWRRATKAETNNVALRTEIARLEASIRERTTSEPDLTTGYQAQADRFLAMTSHEMRTPLNGVIGNVHILSETKLTTEQRELTNTIRMSSETLLSIINDILDYSKLEAGKLELEELEYDVEELVEEAAASLAASTHGKRLELVSFVDPAVPPFVVGDALRLRQILLNLLSNALKFTPSGHVLLRVSNATPDDDTKSTDRILLMFEVEDSGIGMTQEAIERLFKPFTQASTSTSRNYGGTGLGLSICKQLVSMMGGEIGMRSKLGQGSTCWFTALLRRANASPRLSRPPSYEQYEKQGRPESSPTGTHSPTGNHSPPTDPKGPPPSALRRRGSSGTVKFRRSASSSASALLGQTPPQRSLSVPLEMLRSSSGESSGSSSAMQSRESSFQSRAAPATLVGSRTTSVSFSSAQRMAAAASAPRHEYPTLQDMRVLLVDRSPLCLQSVGQMLSRSKARFLTFDNVEGALKQLAANDVWWHVLLVDNNTLAPHLGTTNSSAEQFGDSLYTRHRTRVVVMRPPSLETTHFAVRPVASRSSDNPEVPSVSYVFKPLRRKTLFSVLEALQAASEQQQAQPPSGSQSSEDVALLGSTEDIPLRRAGDIPLHTSPASFSSSSTLAPVPAASESSSSRSRSRSPGAGSARALRLSAASAFSSASSSQSQSSDSSGAVGNSASAPPGSRVSRGHVLLAEDNSVNQKLMVRILEKLGCSVTVAGNGRECVEQFQADPARFKAIFMDYHMPVMDGLAATREIRRLPVPEGSTVPIVALTASALASERDECTAAGMTLFCSKPVVPSMIRKILDQIDGGSLPTVHC